MKSKKLSAVIVTIMSVIIMIGMLCLPASAATSLSKATVSYETNYTYTGKAIKPSVKVKVGSKTLKKDTNYTVSYKNNTNVGKGTITIKGKGSYTGSVSKSFYIEPKAVSSLKATAYSTKIKLSWGKSTGASAYQVYQKIDGKWTKLSNTSKTSYTITDLDSVTKYDFRVRAYAKVGSKVLYSDFKNISKSTTIGKVTELKTSSVTQSSATLTWNEVQGATSYIVKLTDNVSNYNYDDIIAYKNSVVLTSLYGQREYTVKIVARNDDKGITGPNSTAFTFMTALSSVKNLKAEPASSTTVKLTWDKLSGVDAYQVFYAKYDASGNLGKYEKFGNIKTNSCTVDGLFSNSNYSFRVRAYTKTSSGTVYSEYTVLYNFYLPVSVAKIQNFTTTSVSNNEVVLEWTRPNNIDGYKLYVDGAFKTTISRTADNYRLTGLTTGKTYKIAISAYYNDVEGEKTEISVTTQSSDVQSVTITRKPSSTIKPGETFQLQVSVTPSYAANANVTYKSQNTSVATVSNTGLITAIKDGQTVITVTSVANPNKSASFTLTVLDKPVKVSSITLQSSYTIYEGEIMSLNPTIYPADATNKGYTITGSDHSYSYKGGFIGIQNKTETCKFSDYVYVTNTNLIKGVKATIEEKSDKAEKPSFSFKVTIRATDGSGATATTTIKILPRMITVDYNGAEELPWYYGNSAKLSYKLHSSIADSYDSSKIKFKSSNTSIATVTNEGIVTCKGVGDVTITAYTSDGKYSGTYEIYSRGIVEIEDTYIDKCKAGNTYQIKAKILPVGTSDSIIYYTSNSSVVTVDSNGLVTFKTSSGSAKIFVGLASDSFNLKEVWFTTDTFTAPSGTNAQLLNHMRNTVNTLKTLQNVPGLTRYEATTLKNLTTSSNQITGSQLQSIFNSELTPKMTYLSAIPVTSENYIALRKQFLENVPVKGEGHIIESTLTDGDIKSIQVIDNGDYYYEMKLTLKDETFNTLPTTPSATRHGKVFDILTKSYMDGILNKFNSTDQLSINYSSFKQKYHDCTVTVGINKINNHIEYTNYDMNIDINVTGLTLKVSGVSSSMDVSFGCNNIVNVDYTTYS